ncbi:MAG: CAP domain-containing protein [Candidatus Rokuibacteriota bacterium]
MDRFVPRGLVPALHALAGMIALLVFTLLGGAGEPTAGALESAILSAVNEVRRTHGLAPLEPDGALHAVARAHSEAMGGRDVLAHRDPASGSLADRARAAGIAFRAIGENLARSRGMTDPGIAVVQGWMQSPGHRRNILGSRFRKTGVGVWHDGTAYYVTQVFLEPSRLAGARR